MGGRLSRPAGRAPWLGRAALVCGGLALLGFPVAANSYFLRLVTTGAMYVGLAMGLNVLVGQAGLLDMGYVGFFAVGAYARALLASPQLDLHLPFSITLVAAALAGVFLSLAVGIPTLRLRGDYLAIVTLGFSEIVRILLLNLDRPVNLTNGPNGIIHVDPVSVGGVELAGPIANYYLIVSFAAVAYVVYDRLDRSAMGMRWRAVRDDPIAAASLGIDVSKHRILAFVVGSMFASTSGVLFASWQGAVFPQNFTLSELITLYCMVVMGGAGNAKGTLAGAATLTLLPELLRGYSVYRMLIYGVLLVTITAVRPQGFFRGPGRRRMGPPQSGSSPKPRSQPGLVAASSPILEMKGLSRSFGGLRALEDFSLDVKRGEVLSIIGPNGAGKTTLLNIVSGILAPSSGDCFLHGRRITGLPSHAIHRLGLSRTFQNLRLFDNMTAGENILIGGGRMPEGSGAPLAGWLDNPAGNLDYAHRKELEIARAMASDPDLVLLDEPAAGMSGPERTRLADLIGSMRDAGRSVLLIEHQMDLVMQVSDRVVVLDRGRKIAEGTPLEVCADARVAEVYLGMRGTVTRRPAGTQAAPRDPARKPLLELSGVEASYGRVRVLRGVDLIVREGEAVCLLGANGAGKSTTLKTIIGGISPDSGKILFGGRDITAPVVGGRKGMALVPEGRRVFRGMTVEENLLVGGQDGELDRVYSLFPRLFERRRQAAETMSGGEQQMLAIGRALMPAPRLLLLDEPSMGLAPVAADAVFEALDRLREGGVTVLLVEQNVDRALSFCERGYVLRNGTVALHGTCDELSTGADLQDAYLAADSVERQS